MASVTDIRRALEQRLAGIDGEVAVYPGPSDYARGPGFHTVRFVARVIVGPEGDEAEGRLDHLLDEGGVRSLLEADDTLGGLVADVAVAKCSGYQTYGPPDAPHLGAEWTVETRGDT